MKQLNVLQKIQYGGIMINLLFSIVKFTKRYVKNSFNNVIIFNQSK